MKLNFEQNENVIVHNFGDGNVEYIAYTIDIDGEFLTILFTHYNKLIGVFKHITIHDRFYCDSFYGDYDTNCEFAELIDRRLMEIMEEE